MSVPAADHPSATGRPSPPGSPALEFVRPGPNAFTWLVSAIRDLKGGDLLRPVTVIVPNNVAGQMVSWRLSRDGGYVNVRTRRLNQVEAEVARPTRGPRQGFLGPVVEASAVRAVLRDCRDRFGGIEHRSLQEALLELFRELRRAGLDPTSLPDHARSPTSRAALDAYRRFQERVRDYDDPTRRAERAARRLLAARSIPPELDALGAVILWLPTRLDPRDVDFLAAVAGRVPLRVALADLGDPSGPGDRPSEEMAENLARALRIAWPQRESSSTDLGSRTDLRVIRAPDPAEEVREVVRCIAADLERGVPLHRTAILYRQNDPYGPLVREALDLAGLPWSSSEGTRLNESRPGRSLLGLLRLPDQKFARDAVMEWLETEPALEGEAAAIPPASWDRLTRQAGVTRGAEQWNTRLERHAAALEAEADERERDGDSAASVEGRRRRATTARAIAAAVASLAAALRPPTPGARWTDFVEWARALRDRFVGPPDRWADEDRASAVAVDQAIESLRDADRIESTDPPSAGEFLAALEAALGAHRLPTGRAGRGVLIEPVGAVAGLTFDRVYVLGMREGAFPPTPPVDPFFPSDADDPLRRRTRHHAEERRDFLMALATADGGVLTLGVPDSDGARAAFPSRWLLGVASARAGEDLDATRFAALDPSEHPWLRVVRSARHGVSRDLPPVDLEDRRLGEAVRWTDRRLPLDRHPMAHRGDLPLGRALRLAEARGSPRLTPWDGNVSALAGASKRLKSGFDGRRAISATAIQTWAACGFRYFLERVIGVEPTERPKDVWTLNPLERGALLHAVLQQFFSRLAERGRPRPDEDYTAVDVGLIERLAREQLAAVEASGANGNRLVWEMTRSQVLSDLRAFLDADREHRRRQGLTPTYFEQEFGTPAADGWPALGIVVPIGEAARTIGFRGRIDRIDLDRSNRSAYLFDYMTGTSERYKSLKDDPVAAGREIQLALYRRVARSNLPGLDRVGGALWFVSAKEGFKQVAIADDSSLVDRRLDEVVALTVQGIARGAFPQVPGKRRDSGGFENCAFCDFDRICPVRRERISSRKQADPLVAIHRRLAATPEAIGDDE